MLAPLARQSRGCRERSARGPGPGHRTPHRTRPSLELGQLPTSDTAPDTAPHRAGHYNGHYFPAPDTASPQPWTLSPSPSGGRDTEPPAGSSKRPLAPQRLTLPPPCPLLSSPPPAASFPGSGRSPASFCDPLQLGPAARAPIPRLLARMPLPGGLWWLLCCRRGFTLLHRDYGDGELSGDGDEDEDEETFELRTPSSAGGGRVSPGGFGALSQSLSLKPAVTSDPAPDSSQTACSWQTRDVGEVFAWGPGAPGSSRSSPTGDVPVGLEPHAGRCPPARGPEAGEASRVARPGPASPFPAGSASHPVSFRLRQRRGMWRGRLGGSDAWVRSAPSL